MDEGLDTGDIALQARVYLPDGRSAAQLEKLLGKEAGALALKALSILADGPLPRRAQSGTATYNGHPQQADFQISTTWSARRAFNFMRGTSHWNTPYIIRGQNVRLTAHTAIAFDANGTQDVPQRWTEASTTVRFSQGVLEVR
jgi:methionyl-tRNA formyltransferase